MTPFEYWDDTGNSDLEYWKDVICNLKIREFQSKILKMPHSLQAEIKVETLFIAGSKNLNL